MRQITRPLFRFDPGWLFIAAGLAVCAAVMILPVQTDLHGLRMQLDQLRNEETRAYARLKAHSDFMDQVDRAEPALIRRLAATQLNMVPEGDTPVLLAASATVPVTHWIESAVKVDMRPPNAVADTMLSKLVNGPNRLWIFGGGIMAVFFGVLLGTGTISSRRAVETSAAIEESLLLPADDDRIGLAVQMDELDAANELLTADQVTGENEIPVTQLSMRNGHTEEETCPPPVVVVIDRTEQEPALAECEMGPIVEIKAPDARNGSGESEPGDEHRDDSTGRRPDADGAQ